jgi:ankyrin repeat protein
MEKNPLSTLEFGLCHGYGIGTRQDWKECITWIQKAASLGNETAVVYLKSLYPRQQYLEIDSRNFHGIVNIFDFLARVCVLARDKGHASEVYRIIDLLKETEPRRYEEEHPCILPCYCQRYEAPGSAMHNLLHSLWLWCASPQTQEQSEILRNQIHSTDAAGRNLLHLLAACHHPQFKRDKTDTMKKIGKILLSHGCHLDATDLNGHTPLSLATNARNYGMIDLLLERGCSLEGVWSCLNRCAREYAYEILAQILPYMHQGGMFSDTSNVSQLLKLLKDALLTPFAARKLGEIPHSLERSLYTVHLLCRSAVDYGISIDEWIEERLWAIAFAGNEDLLKYFYGKGSYVPRTSLRRNTFQESLYTAILGGNRETFSFLLGQGADPNVPINGAFPIEAAAMSFGRDSFYFWELIGRGANLKFLEDYGVSVLHWLVKDRNGAAATTMMLSEYPSLIRRYPPILCVAALFGYPSTVVAVVEAGADFDKTSGDGLTAIALAAGHTRPHCLENLDVLISFEKRREREGRYRRLGQALTTACHYGRLASVQKLLDAGADPNFEVAQPFIATLARRFQYQSNIDPSFINRKSFEEKKCEAIHQLLVKHGLDSRRGEEKEIQNLFLTA